MMAPLVQFMLDNDGTPDYHDGVLFVEVSSAQRLGSST